MKKLISISLIMLGTIFCLQAQQLPQYSQYVLNRYITNPASAGVDEYFVGQTNYRTQWQGIKDAPRTYILSVNGPLQNQRMGIGGYIFSDITGPTTRNGFSLSYAYHVKVTDEIKLSMAINGGILQYSIDGSELTFADQSDQLITKNLERKTYPDAGFSFYLYADDYYFGASAPQLLQNDLDFEGSISDPSGRLVNHYFVTAGYTYELNGDFDLEPNLLLKYVKPSPLQFEFTLRSIYQDKAWFGLSYRQSDAVVLMAGYNLPGNLSLGYAYDIIQSDLGTYSRGTHEILFSIRFNNKVESAEEVE